MGWIGWTEQQTLDTTIEGIRIAYQGRMDMLAAIFGKSKPAGAPVSESGPSLFSDLKRMAQRQRRATEKNGQLDR